jgi:hypothetical protein
VTLPTDDEWDDPTEVTVETAWMREVEDARNHRITMAAIEREQLRVMARPPTSPPVAMGDREGSLRRD